MWEATNKAGEVVYDNPSIQKAARRHFQEAYAEQRCIPISNELEVVKHYPKIFEQSDCHIMVAPIIEEVVLNTLKRCKGDKILGPYRWTIELYIHLFDLIGKRVTEVLEDTR